MRIQKRFIFVAPLFGFAIASIPPYPNTNGAMLWLVSSILYILVSLLPGIRFREFWLQFGIATFTLMLLTAIWFSHLKLVHGIWYPPDFIPIIQHLYPTDGEATYDAYISNLFIILWFTVTVILAVIHLSKNGLHAGRFDRG